MRLGIVAAALLFAFPAAARASEAEPLKPLAFIAGDWTARMDGTLIEERWIGPHGDLMLGMSLTESRTGAIQFEYLRIETKDGVIAYIAQPGGRPPTAFKLVKQEAGLAVFENLENDFPQRIIYRLIDDNHLTARIENTDGKGIDFPYTRAP